MTKYEKAFQNVILILSSLLFCFLMLEIVLRFFLKNRYTYIPHPKGLYEQIKKEVINLLKILKEFSLILMEII